MDGGEARRVTSRGGAWVVAWGRFFSLRFLLRRFGGLPWRFPRFCASWMAMTDRTAKAGVERAAISARNLRSSRARRSGFGRLKRRSEMLTSGALTGLYSREETGNHFEPQRGIQALNRRSWPRRVRRPSTRQEFEARWGKERGERALDQWSWPATYLKRRNLKNDCPEALSIKRIPSGMLAVDGVPRIKRSKRWSY